MTARSTILHRMTTNQDVTTIPHTDTSGSASTTDACAETVFGWILGMEHTAALYLGDRLGWCRSLAEDGPATAGELASGMAQEPGS